MTCPAQKPRGQRFNPKGVGSEPPHSELAKKELVHIALQLSK